MHFYFVFVSMILTATKIIMIKSTVQEQRDRQKINSSI